MAYDDESSIFKFDEFISLAALFERYLMAPENITAMRLLALVRAVHRISSEGRQAGLSQLAAGLREQGLGTVPFDTVVKVMEVVAKVPYKEDVLAHVTLRDVQRMTSR
jgi:hypothetical protein